MSNGPLKKLHRHADGPPCRILHMLYYLIESPVQQEKGTVHSIIHDAFSRIFHHYKLLAFVLFLVLHSRSIVQIIRMLRNTPLYYLWSLSICDV